MSRQKQTNLRRGAIQGCVYPDVADLSARISTYDDLNDNEDWDIRMQTLSEKSEAHTISLFKH